VRFTHKRLFLRMEATVTKPENPGAWPQLIFSVRAGVKVKTADRASPILLGHTVRQHSSLIVLHVREGSNISTHAELVQLYCGPLTTCELV
jgi:hypothetical protein